MSQGNLDHIIGVSNSRIPKDNTVLYIGSKIKSEVANLEGRRGCVVYIDWELDDSSPVRQDNEIVTCENPASSFAEAASFLEREKHLRFAQYSYLQVEGAIIGEHVDLGKGVIIEPGAFIDHEVSIGDNSRICSGARIRNALIGNHCLIRENAVIGSQGFTMTKRDCNTIRRIPCIVPTVLEDYVEIGANTTVCAGQTTSTRLMEGAKVDDHVYIGHDVELGKRAILTAGVTIGGFCRVGDDAFFGLNSSVRNRLTIGSKAKIGMGSVVTKDVVSGVTVVGSPARNIEVKLD
jgi:UDP-3-O-[3-hydroxymyristoyl] glucosamine N-acyltransferase